MRVVDGGTVNSSTIRFTRSAVHWVYGWMPKQHNWAGGILGMSNPVVAPGDVAPPLRSAVPGLVAGWASVSTLVLKQLKQNQHGQVQLVEIEIIDTWHWENMRRPNLFGSLCQPPTFISQGTNYSRDSIPMLPISPLKTSPQRHSAFMGQKCDA